MIPKDGATQPPAQDGSGQTERLDNVRNILGLLLAGFTGAVNLIGLRSAELTTVLRNQGILVGLASVLLLAALICAMASIFAERSYRIHLWLAGAVTAALLSIAAVSIYVVKIPKAATWARGWVLGCSLLLAALAVAGMSAWLVRRPRTPTVSLQFVLLVASAILFSSATTTVVRIEARNQAVTSLPQIETTVEREGNLGAVTANIAATKLRDNEYVLLTVEGLPRGSSTKEQYPCSDTKECLPIADVDVNPDSFGNIDRTFEFPFSAAAYRHLLVSAFICEAEQAREECEIGEKTTLVDLRLD
ncbi:hypothetical protein [Streptomyces sp. NPDC050585]|uniref:hypothetical protein n=1 Tax=unclassified Streptomyces TaxID=2593676 RepID=UPI00378F18D5